MRRKIFIFAFIIFKLNTIHAESDINFKLLPEVNYSYSHLKNSLFNKDNELNLEKNNLYFNQNIDLSMNLFSNLSVELATRTYPEFYLDSWNIKYIFPSSFLNVAFSNEHVYFGQNKILKAADYFGWLFSNNDKINNKTNLSVSLLFDIFAFEFIYAPVFKFDAWKYFETYKTDPILTNIGSVYYLQGQYFKGALEGGIFSALSENFNSGESVNISFGTWSSWMFNDDSILYGESLYSNISENLFRISLGCMHSFQILPISLYLEGMYNSNGFVGNDWDKMSESLEFIEVNYPQDYIAVSKGLKLQSIYFDYINRFSAAIHLRNNYSYFGFLNTNLTVLYYYPETFLTSLYVDLDCSNGLKIYSEIFIPTKISNNFTFYDCFTYDFKINCGISFSIYTKG